MIFLIFPKKLGFLVFLVHTTMVSVLLSASVERCFVSRMQDFFLAIFRPYQRGVGQALVAKTTKKKFIVPFPKEELQHITLLKLYCCLN